MWAWKYVLKDEILDMLLAHKSLPCEDAKRIGRNSPLRRRGSRQWLAAFSPCGRRSTMNLTLAFGDSSVAHDIVMIWTRRRGKSVKVVANKSWLGALQPASQEEKAKSLLHTNFDVNALLEREALKPIWDKLTKKADKTAAATQAESADEGALDDAALVKAAIRLSEPNEAKATELKL